MRLQPRQAEESITISRSFPFLKISGQEMGATAQQWIETANETGPRCTLVSDSDELVTSVAQLVRIANATGMTTAFNRVFAKEPWHSRGGSDKP
jgi:hypothetical protein